ncbi:MAG: nitrite reductase small subunit NirD [Vibrio sp.]
MWQQICKLSQLDSNLGVGAVINNQQVALFYVPTEPQKVFAIDNWDPIGKAFVLSRGIVGDVKGKPCVASPLYKQHFELGTGNCVEQPEVQLKIWQTKVENDEVWVMAS